MISKLQNTSFCSGETGYLKQDETRNAGNEEGLLVPILIPVLPNNYHY
jgi:hypothetical protein